MRSDPLVARIRPLMLRKDYVGDWSTEQILQQCLEANPSNRMAFEYLLAHYLLTSDMKGLASLAPRLKDFYRELPTHVQEALLGFRNVNGSLPPGIDGSAIDRETESAFGASSRSGRGTRTVLPKKPGRPLRPVSARRGGSSSSLAAPQPGRPRRPVPTHRRQRQAHNEVTEFESGRFAATLILPVLCVLSACQARWPEGAQPVSRRPVLYPDLCRDGHPAQHRAAQFRDQGTGGEVSCATRR